MAEGIIAQAARKRLRADWRRGRFSVGRDVVCSTATGSGTGKVADGAPS